MPSNIYQVRGYKEDGPLESFFCSNLKEAASFRRQLRRHGYKIVDTIKHKRPVKKADLLQLLNGIGG